jgi:hemolysin (HlyC) family protein
MQDPTQIAMPDTDAPGRSEQNVPAERINLPVPVPRPSEVAREGGESWFSRVLRAVFGWKQGTIRADLEVVLEAAHSKETGFSPEESTMLRNILGLRTRRVDDVMIPRADIVSVQRDIALGDLIRVFEGAAHSRLVVYNESLDDPVGMVHIRDVIGYMVRHAAVDPEARPKRKKPLPAGLDLRAVDLTVTLSAAGIIREILFVPPSMPALDLLAKMQTTRIHLALVIDEYGGTDGLVSIEDLVEEIVGEIADEHDDDEKPAIVRQADGSFIADARANIEDVVATVGAEFAVGEAADEVDTLAGYLMARGGRLPARGEVVQGPQGFEIQVLDADPRRVKKVRIARSKDPERQRRRGRTEIEAVRTDAPPPAANRNAPAGPDRAPSDTASS